MSLPARVTELWDRRSEVQVGDPDAVTVVDEAMAALDAGTARVAEVVDDEVVVHEWAKHAILLSFRLYGVRPMEAGPFRYHDRLPLKTDFAGARVVPGAVVRYGAFIAPSAVLMPSFVNVGGYVDENSMVDTWATVGSCAQIGARVHLAGGVGIGGVLEPAQAAPVVIEDDAFVGSRCVVVNGARVGRGAVLGAGVVLTDTTHVIDVETGEDLPRGRVPAGAVVVNGTRPREFAGGTFGMPCVLVLRRLPPGESHDKLALNELLREHGVAQ